MTRKQTTLLAVTFLLALHQCSSSIANISQQHKYLLACKASHIEYVSLYLQISYNCHQVPEFLSPLTQSACDLACLYQKFEEAYKKIKPLQSPSTDYHQLGVRTALFSYFIQQYQNNIDQNKRNLKAFYTNSNLQLSLSLTNYGYQAEADLVNLTNVSKCQICEGSTSPQSTSACPSNYQASNAKQTTQVQDLAGMNNNQIINYFIDYTYFKCHSIPFCSTVYRYENKVYLGPALPASNIATQFAINLSLLQNGGVTQADQNNLIESSLVGMINETFAFFNNGVASGGKFKFSDLSIRSRTVIMIVVARLYYSNERVNLINELKNGNLQYIYDKLNQFKLYQAMDILAKNQKCGDSGEADIMFVVDGSGSVGSSSYWKGIQFIKNIADQIQLGKQKIRIGAFQYNHAIYQNQLSDLSYDKDFIKNNLSALHYTSGGTNTANAIMHGINKLKTGTNARSGVQKIMIVMTDGHSNLTAVQNAVVEMHKQGIQGFAIGIGSGFNYAELKAIGADKNDPNIDPDVYTVSDYSKLIAIINSIIKSICTTPAKLSFNNNSNSQGNSNNPPGLTPLDITAQQEVQIKLEKSGANFSIYSKVLINLQNTTIVQKFNELAVRLEFTLSKIQSIEPPSISINSKNPNRYNFDFQAVTDSGIYQVDIPIVQAVSISWDQNNQENIQVIFYIGINALEDNTDIKIKAKVVKIQKPLPKPPVPDPQPTTTQQGQQQQMLFSGLTLMQVLIITGASVIVVVAVIGFTTCCCLLRAKKKRAAKNQQKENNRSGNDDRSIMYRIQSMLGLNQNAKK